MAAEEPQEVHSVVGALHLSVSYIASAPLGPGELISRFSWRVASADPHLPGTLFDDHLHEVADRELSARDGLRALAGLLVEAGEGFFSQDPGTMELPLWLSAMAARHLNDLKMVALTGVTPAEMVTVGIPADRLLLAVEVAREALHAETQMSGPGVFDTNTLAALQRFAARADRDVAVPDPGDPLGPPLYEGPASEAHQRLSPGRYQAHLRHHPGQRLVVIVARSELSGGPMAASFTRLRPTGRPRTPPTNGPGASSDTPHQPRSPRQSGGWTPRPPTAPPDSGADPLAPGL
ncbi:hypothetical protein [Jiangella alba]|uniref:Uncharacterized protein n=1 Tax=Jiangella alba TaxID=561176 RepID=A0A1H5J910_9ACTN|nr:hypothetical protein [Jiangella alba]SEE48900.1 hypothetical protein SAMN04488561_1488 [Jiangella alba]